ncbi:hypothetical protein K7432_010745 [Basidiobolus ranarum]|uniref:Uncharacterized protein n=1 Tax=Basidiobolus ranarum TaxID=34480 RepID=A0ABR2VV28_9FUNG
MNRINQHSLQLATHLILAKKMSLLPEPVVTPTKQHKNLSTLATSYFVSPRGLAVFRALACIYTIVVFVCNVVNYRSTLLHFFTQFACLAYLGLIVYLLMSLCLSYTYLKNPSDELENSILRRYPSLRLTHSLLYITTQVFHTVIPVIYWTAVMRIGFEYRGSYQFWLSLSLHGGSLILTLVELCLNKIEISWIQLPFLLFVVVLYFGLTWIYYTYIGHSMYAIITGQNTLSALIVRYMLMLGIFVIMFIVIYYLHKVRTNFGKNLEKTDEQPEETITEEIFAEPKPTSWNNHSVIPPSSQAQTFSHILTFF